ncbi:MAG: hypothetical protein AB7K09_00160 [Planctomycetota bacterium]
MPADRRTNPDSHRNDRLERSHLVLRPAVIVGGDSAPARASSRGRTGFSDGNLLNEWQLTHTLPMALMHIGDMWLAADPTPIRMVNPAQPLPGAMPSADFDLADELGAPLPPSPDWHVISLEVPKGLTIGGHHRTLPVRISVPSAVLTVNVPLNHVRGRPPLLASMTSRGMAGFLLDRGGQGGMDDDHRPPRIATLIDLLAITSQVLDTQV